MKKTILILAVMAVVITGGLLWQRSRPEMKPAVHHQVTKTPSREGGTPAEPVAGMNGRDARSTTTAARDRRPPESAPTARMNGRDARSTTTTMATVTVGARTQALTPDEGGQFGRVYIEPKQTVPVTLHFAQGQADDPVAVRVEDGGRLDNEAPGKLLKLDGERNIAFTFQANADLGIYRVVVTKNGVAQVLNFWAGPEMPVAAR